MNGCENVWGIFLSVTLFLGVSTQNEHKHRIHEWVCEIRDFFCLLEGLFSCEIFRKLLITFHLCYDGA